jgi:hypothetical protein
MTKKVLVSATEDDLISEYWSGEPKKEQLNPTEVFKQYCENEPGALECRIYDV